MKNTNKILTALGIGVAAGAVLGLLFAPRKGKDTREILAKKGTQFSDNIRNGIKEGQRKIDNIKEGLNGLQKKVEEVM